MYNSVNMVYSIDEDMALFIYELKEDKKYDFKQIAKAVANKYPKLGVVGFDFKAKDPDTKLMVMGYEYSAIDGMILYRDACSILNNTNIKLDKNRVDIINNKVDNNYLVNNKKYESQFNTKPNVINGADYNVVRSNNNISTEINLEDVKEAYKNGKIHKA